MMSILMFRFPEAFYDWGLDMLIMIHTKTRRTNQHLGP